VIVLKSDNLKTHLPHNIFAPGIVFLLPVVYITVHFNHKCQLMAIKINDETSNDLLPTKVNT
jgi:hypothetical protein